MKTYSKNDIDYTIFKKENPRDTLNPDGRTSVVVLSLVGI
jgi:hypothetical protein